MEALNLNKEKLSKRERDYLDSLIVPYLKAKKDTDVLHKLFSYPAKFQARLPASIISKISEEGDLIVDPFSGGGTTSAEAVLQGRNSFAMDLNPISVLVTKAKTTILSEREVNNLISEIQVAPVPKSYKFLTKDESHLLGPTLANFSEAMAKLSHKIKNRKSSYLLATVTIKRIKLAARRDKEHLRTASFQNHKDYICNEITKIARVFELIGSSTKCANTVECGSNHDMPLRNGTADLIITSPPYPSVDVEYNLIQLQRRDLRRCYRSDLPQRISQSVLNLPGSPKKKDLCNGGVDSDDYWLNSKRSLLEMKRVMKKTALCILYIGFKGEADQEKYEKLLKGTGLKIVKSYPVELGKERVASSRGIYHGKETKMMKADVLYVIRK